MAVTDQQKIDFLLKKIGFTKTKTGSVVGTGAISGTPKQPFAEAIPSPLIIANGALWNESGSIPATPPGSDTNQVKVYLAGSSGLRMTADSTSSGQRAYIAYTTYGNTSSARLTNWIDTQFGAGYLIKVYKGDPNSGGVALSAAGSGANDGWFFDYSAGVLNFNDTNVPSGVTDTNIYIVGYRYIGLTGAPTPTGGGDFTFNDLVVSRNFSVGGLSTFTGNIDANGIIEGIAGENKIPSLYANLGALPSPVTYHGMFAHVHSTGRGYFSHAGGWYELVNRESNGVVGTGTEAYNIGNINAVDGTFSGNVSIGGTLTYEDVKNVDAVGLITARSGIRVTGGVIEAQAGENKIPSLYSNLGALPNPGTYHGMFAHVHSTGRGYFSHAGGWYELVNVENNGVVGTGTQRYNLGALVSTSTTATSLNVTGVSTFAGTIDANGIIEGISGENKIPSLYSNMGALPNPSTYHGMFAHVHSTGRGYFSHAGGWYELVNRESNGVVGTGTERYNIGALVSTSTTATSLNVAGVSTFASSIYVADSIIHDGDTDTKIDFVSNQVKITAGNKLYTNFGSAGYNYLYAATNFVANSSSPKPSTYVARFRDEEGDDTEVQFFNTNIKNSILEWNDYGNTTAAGNLIFKGISSGSGLEHARFTGSGNFNLLRDLDVDGHTNLDNVSIAGVTSVASLTSGRVVTAGTGGKLQDSNNLTFDGNNLFVSGINVTGGGSTSTLGADIVTRNLKATGVSTFVGDVQFDSGIKADGSTGSNGQYLKTTGSGVEWASFPTMRTTQTFTASAGQTTFSFSYNIGFLDVFVNGVKLTDSEFTATNGTTVVLAVGCFVGDIVDVISYHTVSGGGGGGGGGISNVVEDTTPQLGGNLDLFNKSITGTGNVNITGIISATSFKGPSGVTATFIGDGSGLTNVIGSGSGVVIKDDNNTVGTAGTINFAENLSVTPISAGIVTVGFSSASLNVNKLNVTGITTFVGITSFTKRVDFNGVDSETWFWAHPNLPQSHMVWKSGVAGGNGGLFFSKSNIYLGAPNSPSRTHIDIHGDGSNGHLRIEQYMDYGDNPLRVQSDFLHIEGSPTNSHQFRKIADFTYQDGCELYYGRPGDNAVKFATSGVGATVYGQLDATNINASGVTTTTEVRSNALSLKNAAGSATYATFTNGGSALLKHNNTDRLETSASGVTVTGTVAATSYTGDGSQLTGIGAGSTADIRTNTLEVVGVSTFAGITTVTGNTLFTKQLSVSGVSTFARSVRITGAIQDFTVDSGTFRYDNGKLFLLRTGQNAFYYSGVPGGIKGPHVFYTHAGGSTVEMFRLNGDTGATLVGVMTATKFVGDGSGLTGISGGVTVQDEGSALSTTATTLNFVGSGVVASGNGATKTITIAGGSSQDTFRTIAVSGQSDVVADNATDTLTLVAGSNMTITTNAGSDTITFASSGGGGGGTDVGITTSLTGTFTASAGSPSTINTFAYHDNDKVVEYTVYIKNGSDFQSQKLLAMRDGTTIHSTQFAVMFSSSLLVQLDATISSDGILLRATPETGVSGSTSYRIKREVM